MVMGLLIYLNIRNDPCVRKFRFNSCLKIVSFSFGYEVLSSNFSIRAKECSVSNFQTHESKVIEAFRKNFNTSFLLFDE